ncbi:C39 family peptidase [Candidatus Nomurabacteria bacterium]|nr:C39 family peptidase [Candidatus Nomurabacteria bacterium]
MKFKNLFENRSEIIDGHFEISDVPFYSQRLTKENYQKEGFNNWDEAEYWSERICGLACLKMVLLKNYPDQDFKLKELLDRGLALGAYDEEHGWKHQGLVDLGNSLGLDGFRESVGANVKRIATHIQNQRMVIASVTVGFEAGKKYEELDGSTDVMPRGGHLVLIFGTDVSNGRIDDFILHHPSSEGSYEHSNWKISGEDFSNSFSEKGNVIIF